MQCSFRDTALPAMRFATLTLFAALAATTSPLLAQVQLVVSADLRAKPGGPAVALLSPGTRLTTGATSGAETLVTFEGWVDGSRLGGRRDSFPASVSGRLTLRVRSQPSTKGTIIAVLQPGAGLHIVSRQGNWTRVRRAAWIRTAVLQRAVAGARAVAGPAAPVAAPQASAGPPAPAQDKANAAGEPAAIASTGARFRDLPVGRVLGSIAGGSTVEVMARESGWVRVRADGWIAEKDLVTGASVAPPSLTAADLRADPQAMKGHVVQWDVEVMAFQIADPLRVELAREEPYLLVRGPGAENALLYLAVPEMLLTEARALGPLAKITVTARVRSGRSEPAGTPILDLLSMIKPRD